MGILTYFTLTLRLGQNGLQGYFQRGLALIESAILHGLRSYNVAAVHVLREFGRSNPANLKSFDVVSLRLFFVETPIASCSR